MKTLCIYKCIFIALVVFLGFSLSSCEEKGYAIINLHGTMRDNQGNYIDSLMVTIHNTTSNTKDIFRSSTSSNGFDRTYTLKNAEACKYTIEIEDIDGETNGGFFQTQKKTVDILTSDYTKRNDLMVVHPYASKQIDFIMMK